MFEFHWNEKFELFRSSTEQIDKNNNFNWLKWISQSYQTDLGVLAVANPEVEVNKWINQTTKGKIPKIVGQ